MIGTALSRETLKSQFIYHKMKINSRIISLDSTTTTIVGPKRGGVSVQEVGWKSREIKARWAL
jgi:hypothetical protein